MRSIRLLLFLVLPLSLPPLNGQEPNPGPIAVGSSTRKVDLVEGGLELFCYKPKDYKDGPLFLVCHGVKRNADDYRDNAIDLAERHKALVVAPKFDLERFPTRDYQRGGLLDTKGELQAKEQWTWSLLPRIAEAVRKMEGRPDQPYYLIGHSAGGQFLVRMAGFVKTDAKRIVAANPGTHLFPDFDFPFPYGFGMLPNRVADDEALKRYLAQPLTIFLGTADKEKDEYLEVTELANKQGAVRLERGRNAFAAGRKLAKDKGWAFNWELVEAEGVGHDSKKMFGHAQCDKALAQKGKQPDLRIEWEKNFLTIRGAFPGESIRVHYLEAYCRPGSTDRDWKETMIGHKTELVSADPDGKRIRLKCKLNDGVVVEHDITAVGDEIDFRIVANNPTDKESLAHWAQPCIRLDRFSGGTQKDYIEKSFLFLDGKAERMPTRDWATEARYTPGQVWCPKNVDRNDVNPRPLSKRVPSNGLIGCKSSDDKWLFATAFEPYQELFQGVAVCLHSDFRIGGLKPGETKKIRGKIYIVHDDLAKLTKRYQGDFPEHAAK